MLIDKINGLCLERLGREPNLDNPSGFNDLIQWLKLYDQRPEQITACDKWGVRSIVKRKADCLIPARLGLAMKWKPSVLKCTHDCGSIQVVSSMKDIPHANEELSLKLKIPYGVEKGEWAYQFVKPRIISEKMLARDMVDYKFHCSHSEIRWCQVISERRHEDGPKETILAPDGSLLQMHMDQNMRHFPDAGEYPGDEAWERLTDLARALSDGWRYVRVDLYWHAKKAWFGELTFWPLAGCYMTEYEPMFGEMLQLDLSYRMEPIVK